MRSYGFPEVVRTEVRAEAPVDNHSPGFNADTRSRDAVLHARRHKRHGKYSCAMDPESRKPQTHRDGYVDKYLFRKID